MTATLFCGHCGETMPASAKFCGSCGDRQEPIDVIVTPAPVARRRSGTAPARSFAAPPATAAPPAPPRRAAALDTYDLPAPAPSPREAQAPARERAGAPAPVRRPPPAPHARVTLPPPQAHVAPSPPLPAGLPHEIQFASWGARLGALMIDWLIGFAAAFALYAVGMGLLASENTLAAGVIVIAAIFVLAPLVAFVFLAWQLCRSGDRNGQTIGKQALGIRIVRGDGRPVGITTVLMRYVVIGVFYIVTLLIGMIVDYLWPLWDEHRQALHDKVADTFVVVADGTVATQPYSGSSGAAPPRVPPPRGF